MSKITSKNLSYDSTLPPFLQRLQSNHASSSDGRHEFTISRPRKPIDEDAERESEPVVFDEVSGETLSKEEWERREKEQEEGGVKENEGEGEGEGVEKKENANAKMSVGIGGSKKRKVGKVIGGLEDEENENEKGEEEKKNGNKSLNKKDTGNQKKSESGKIGATATSKTKPKATAKKGKKIKLSFGDDEGACGKMAFGNGMIPGYCQLANLPSPGGLQD
ncbi:hypothetical protein BPAE_0436g00020 [Botrytis paeoniae]|uniref:DUF4604 domain-containing protein n=1 Tax=Botrytis paeoniae TaxID=278948 RepID=A0A4Z1F2R2_9HELO|nr:hypothetical protein BPAE_0436g00020 [Botrytis paeoniae]